MCTTRVYHSGGRNPLMLQQVLVLQQVLGDQGFLVGLVPRRGLEPPRLAALVPETSASTNSATWAARR
jgi:hypothetical protein